MNCSSWFLRFVTDSFDLGRKRVFPGNEGKFDIVFFSALYKDSKSEYRLSIDHVFWFILLIILMV